ncbi:uncharacterized protein LOC142640195 [Castanea sativa]|uniref:uncharacterized protein LOC142640195 n=1 Tax=Castanea sativa TaxID=21020 RepID=UPI003F651BC9
MGNDVMNKALQQISKSPFVRAINKAKLPHRFSQPTFTIYNGRSDPVEHVSHFNQKMTIHYDNEAFMCKVIRSSLGPVAMWWFYTLEEGSIRSFQELTRAFGARFITCNRVSKPLNSLLSMAMREGETLKTYSDMYWETYNEINRDFEDVVVRTFKEDQTQGKGKAKLIPEKKDPWGVGHRDIRPIRDFPNQKPSTGAQVVNSLFKESIYQIIEKIKNESYFKWPNRMGGDLSRRNQSLYCHYHKKKGHTMEDCWTLRDYLGLLVKAGKLGQFLHQPTGHTGHSEAGYQRGVSHRQALGTVNVIFAKPGGDVGTYLGVMSVVGSPDLGGRG